MSPRQLARVGIAFLKEGEEAQAFKLFQRALTWGEGRIHSEIRELADFWPMSRRILRHIAADEDFPVRFDASSITHAAQDVLDSFGDQLPTEPEPPPDLIATRMMRTIFPFYVMPSVVPTSKSRAAAGKPPRPSEE